MRTNKTKIFRASLLTVATSTLCLAGLPGAAANPAATGEILNAGGAGAIPHRYLVRFAEDTMSAQDVDATTRTLTQRYGGQVQHRFSAVLRGFSVVLDENSARRMAADPAVAYVEQSHWVHAADVQENPPSYGVDRIDQRDLPLDNKYHYTTAGEGIVVYDIDTGINKDHPDFEGRASYGPDYINNDEESADDNGHGTHTAGTAVGKTFGVAKKATVVGIKVLDGGGSGPDDLTIKALDWIVQNGQKPGVINMSLTADQKPHQGMNEATENAAKAGFLSAAAAGNDSGDACLNSPASAPSALTVGASTQSDAKAGFSSIGKCLDLFAPGENITSASHTGSGSSTMSGTSMAAPHVAGAAAVYFGVHRDATVQQAHDDIVAATTQGAIADPGSGSPNTLLYVGE